MPVRNVKDQLKMPILWFLRKLPNNVLLLKLRLKLKERVFRPKGKRMLFSLKWRLKQKVCTKYLPNRPKVTKNAANWFVKMAEMPVPSDSRAAAAATPTMIALM